MATNLCKHLKVIRTHRKYVRKACFKMGLFWQGLVHDLSKYSPTELSIAKYYNGKRSPHEECRAQLGYSPCWIHHYHKNKHHWEYWLDTDAYCTFKPIKMPYKYVIESVCDMIGASKAYNRNNWNAKMPFEYWQENHNDNRIMHVESIILAKSLIEKLSQIGEPEFYKWYKEHKSNLEKAYNDEKIADYLNEIK